MRLRFTSGYLIFGSLSLVVNILVSVPFLWGQTGNLPAGVESSTPFQRSSVRRHFSEEEVKDLQNFSGRMNLNQRENSVRGREPLFRVPQLDQEAYSAIDDGNPDFLPYAHPPGFQQRSTPSIEPLVEEPFKNLPPNFSQQHEMLDHSLPNRESPPLDSTQRMNQVASPEGLESSLAPFRKEIYRNRDHQLPTPPPYLHGNRSRFPIDSSRSSREGMGDPLSNGDYRGVVSDADRQPTVYSANQYSANQFYQAQPHWQFEHHQGIEEGWDTEANVSASPGASFFCNPQRDMRGIAGYEELSQVRGNSCGFDCSPPNFYLSGFGMGTWVNPMDSGSDVLQANTGGGFGVALGQRQGRNLRMELEYVRRINGIGGVETPGGFQPISGKLRAQSGMANAWWEMVGVRTPLLKPYVGAGLGFVKFNTDLSDSNGMRLTSAGDRESSFAYQFFGGVNYQRFRHADLFVEYRLFKSDGFSIRTTTGVAEGNYHYQSHNLMGGLRWKF